MYLFFGLLIGLSLGILVFWLARQGIRTKWYHWLLLALGALLLVFAAQNFFAGLEEHAPKFSWLFLLTIGLPGLICLVAAFILIRANNSRA